MTATYRYTDLFRRT